MEMDQSFASCPADADVYTEVIIDCAHLSRSLTPLLTPSINKSTRDIMVHTILLRGIPNAHVCLVALQESLWLYSPMTWVHRICQNV